MSSVVESMFQFVRRMLPNQAPRIRPFDLVLASLRLKPRPFKLQLYELKTDEVHKFSMALCASILLVAAIFSGWLLDDPLASFSDDACLSPEGQIELYAEEVKNFTGFYESMQLRRHVNVTERQLYADSVSVKRNCRDYNAERCKWPIPYNSDCKIIYRVVKGYCVTDFNAFERLFVDDVCVPQRKVAFDPCADDTNFDASAEETSAVPQFRRTNETAKIENAVAKVVREVVHRAQFASSIYCVWVAAMIFIGPAYHVYSYSLGTRVQNMLIINKPLFMVFVVVLWYLIEAVRAFLIENPGMIKIFTLAQRDPCFVDSEFLTELQETFATICTEIGQNQRGFQHINSVIDYYAEVEATWIDSGRQAGSVYNAYAAPEWTPGCNADDNVLELLSVPQTKSNGIFYLVNSGYIAAIFMQPLLVNFIWYVAEITKPLCAYHGRVIAAEHSDMSNAHVFDNFIRAQYILSLIFTSLLLVFVTINLFL